MPGTLGILQQETPDTTSRSVADILIVRAGPAGLTLAHYLATCVIPFRVIDPTSRARSPLQTTGRLPL
jgi:2-polyprenyl-6-methoxyphenol hydroxylase-like FAD-dependent oxidoreductase